MNWIVKLIIGLLLLINIGCTVRNVSELKVINLKCEFMNEALIDIQSPRFSWELTSKENGQYQKSFQIIVSANKSKIESGSGDIWNSGKIKGNQTFGVKLPEKRLQSFTKYYWSVRVWNNQNQVTKWSRPATFITGAFNKSDWKASWIGDKQEPPLGYPLLYKHIGYLSSYTDNENEEKWVQIDLSSSKVFEEVRLFPSDNNVRKIKDYYFPYASGLRQAMTGKHGKNVLRDQKLKPLAEIH